MTSSNRVQGCKMVSHGLTKDHKGKWNKSLLLTGHGGYTGYEPRSNWGGQGRVHVQRWHLPLLESTGEVL